MTTQRDEIPPELLRFLHSSIDSVEQLQILLLLAEDNSSDWTIDSVSRELRSTYGSVEKRIMDLQNSGVLTPEASLDGKLRFLPSSPAIKEIVLELTQIYRQRPHRVIAQIYNKPPAALQSFADAFLWKKEEK